ncbi:MAG: protein kinase family protein [Proteobacteria bacterium]|nr:protein kinase family protein [Pseudomonadota bacterium]
MTKDENKCTSALQFNDDEWTPAKKYFEANPDAKRLKKQNKNLHSFIKVKDKLIALANKNVEGILGTGGYGVVRLGQDKDGNKYAVKVEGAKKVNEELNEYKIMTLLNYYHGTMQRMLPVPKEHLNKLTNVKTYTLMELQEGIGLNKIKSLNYNQKLICAIACCKAVKTLHSKKIIHADIKSDNFVARIEKNNIKIKAIDFGISMILPKGKNFIIDHYKGTKDFMAPEVRADHKFSFSSDIYALGVMFEKQLGLYRRSRLVGLIVNMTHPEASQRWSLDQAINTLLDELKEQPDLDEDAKRVLEENQSNWNLNGVLKYVKSFFYKPL